MYRFILFKSHLVMIIIFILCFGHINIISSESLSSQTWSNIIQDLSSKIHDYKSDDKIIESHPLNEGFILLAENPKKPSPTRTTTKSSRISPSHNISSTTCKTIIMVKITNRTPSPVGHRGRRLLNELSYDTDIDTSSMQTPVEDDGEFDNFLKVDNDELSKQLFKFEVTTDGSGETTEDTTEQTSEMITTSYEPTTSSTTSSTTTTSTTSSTTTTSTISSTTTGSTTTSTTPAEVERPNLSRNTTFILTLDCENASTTLDEILNNFNESFVPDYTVNTDDTDLQGNCSGKINVTLVFNTDNDTTIQNNIYAILKNVTRPIGVEIYSSNKCGRNETVLVDGTITSCYLIGLCGLCGINPQRGVCLPENNVSTCRCFNNEQDPARPYAGEFCSPSPIPAKPPSIPSRWTPVIVGILSGLTGLFCAITCCLWAVVVWRRRRRNHKPDDLRIRRLWHLPRAQMPTSVANENPENSSNNTISTLDSNRTDSNYNRSNTTDSTFFKELDKKMGENLRATITRPNTQAMLASLPSDTISTLSSYDPIDELDSIIDNEDINTTFHDPLNELFDDNEIFEIRNPNLKLPRPMLIQIQQVFFRIFKNITVNCLNSFIFSGD